MVRYEAAILLGDDDHASHTFVTECRRRMAAAYKANMIIIRELEKEHYGSESYYRLVETGQYRAPQFEGDYSRSEETEVSTSE